MPMVMMPVVVVVIVVSMSRVNTSIDHHTLLLGGMWQRGVLMLGRTRLVGRYSPWTLSLLEVIQSLFRGAPLRLPQVSGPR